jgi:hypothetical protein
MQIARNESPARTRRAHCNAAGGPDLGPCHCCGERECGDDGSNDEDPDPADRTTSKRTQPRRLRFELFLAFATEHAIGLKHLSLLLVRRS